ncbi:YjiH family protein [Haloferax volcanii]|uniref:Transporter gate domain protein n=3 Tax=Haloferax volcanii TaxID=2246 RepID=A0A384L733_HALVD|nr:nucleoside recognition domain-containing protein [Haloferax volcanii]ADE02172.1 uncharacterized protein HVO_A0094 [Haloferax volcanii DS2]ELY28902.1 transporter gate domain protein [Haloferax volcanii DS2]MBS8121073.1 YjiH family protein [Haloferax volcanii]MBS8126084.1 YjiH family protein [Haloferax volcanii]MBS8129938.1 YjiH family protein [Haloferax volcanii]
MFNQDAWTSDHETWEEPEEESKAIGDVLLSELGTLPLLRFVTLFAFGVAFFVFPVPQGSTLTVPFDIVVGGIERQFAGAVLWLSWLMVVVAAVLTTLAELHSREVIQVDDQSAELLHLDIWTTSSAFWVLRIAGAFMASGFLFGIGPAWFLAPEISNVVWGTLVLSIVIIIPLGSIFVNLLVDCGALEFVGTLARPVMKPLFGLPGRAALDGAASWAGSFAIGFYVTRKLFDRGGYNKREVFIICSCFGTGSIGTIGVFASAFEMLEIFPVVLFAYLLAIVAVGVISIRLPPLSHIPEEYVAEPTVEPNLHGSLGDFLRLAVREAVAESEGMSTPRSAWKGFIDGLQLTATIVGTVVSVGTTVLLLYHNTSVFQTVSTPLEPVIVLFGIPNAETVASALVIGFADMYVAALTAVTLQPAAQFFVLLVVSGQILFLSASGPMMMDMFEDVPVRFRDIVAIFSVRTLVLIPVCAFLTHSVAFLGLL